MDKFEIPQDDVERVARALAGKYADRLVPVGTVTGEYSEVPLWQVFQLDARTAIAAYLHNRTVTRYPNIMQALAATHQSPSPQENPNG